MESPRPMDLANESLQDLIFTIPAMRLWFKLGRPTSIPQDDSAESIALRGLCLMIGLGGCIADPDAGRALLQQAASMKSLVALEALGAMSMSEDPFGEETLALARQSAELGWPEKITLLLTAASKVNNDPKLAVEALETAERYGGKDGFLFWSLYQSFKDQPEARQWLDKALECNSPEAHFDMAEILTAEGKTADADAMLRTGVDLGDAHCAGKLLAGYLRQKPHPDTEPLIPRYAEIAASDANPFYALHYAITFVDGRGRPADPKAAIAPLALLCLTRDDVAPSFKEMTASLIGQYYSSTGDELKVPASVITDWLFPRMTAKFCRESFISYMPMLRRFAFLPESDHPASFTLPA